MVKCPKCQYENADAALMCNLCGQVLRRVKSSAPLETAPAPGRHDFEALAARQVLAAEPFGLELDFSPASLLALDVFLDHSGGARALGATGWQPTAGQNAAIIHAGAYFGEVVRRCLGGRWLQPPGDNLAEARLDFPALTIQPFRAGYLRLRDGDRAPLHATYEDCRAKLGVTRVPQDTVESWLVQARSFLDKHRPELARRFVARASQVWPSDARVRALAHELEAALAKAPAASVEPPPPEAAPAAVAPPAPAPPAPPASTRPAAGSNPAAELRALRHELAGHLKRRDFAAALPAVERLLERVPGERGALIDRGLALAGLGRVDEAVATFERVIAAFPDDLEAYDARLHALLDAGRLTDALAATDAILTRAPGRTPTLRMRAGVLMRLGEKARALEAVTRATELSPDEPSSWVLRGTIEGKLLRSDQARASLQRAVALATGKDAEALAVAQRELRQLEALSSLMGIADARASQDPTQLALAVARAQLSAAPPVAPAAALEAAALAGALSRAAVLLNQGNHAAALPLLRSTAAAAPASLEAHLAHARAALAGGAFEEATLAGARAAVLDPASGAAWRLRGQAYDQLRHRTDAVVAYDAAVAHSARDPDLWTERALALLALRRFDDGLQSAQRALALDARHAMGRFVVSLALDALGQGAEALRSYQQFLGIAPQALVTPMRHARERIAELKSG